MEVLGEIILSLLVEGSAAGVTSRKVPRAVRVLLGAFLLLLLGGTGVLLLWCGAAMDIGWGKRLLFWGLGLLPLWYLARLGRALVKR